MNIKNVLIIGLAIFYCSAPVLLTASSSSSAEIIPVQPKITLFCTACPNNSRTFSITGFGEHLRDIHKTKFNCPHGCKSEFSWANNFFQHLCTKHGEKSSYSQVIVDYFVNLGLATRAVTPQSGHDQGHTRPALSSQSYGESAQPSLASEPAQSASEVTTTSIHSHAPCTSPACIQCRLNDRDEIPEHTKRIRTTDESTDHSSQDPDSSSSDDEENLLALLTQAQDQAKHAHQSTTAQSDQSMFAQTFSAPLASASSATALTDADRALITMYLPETTQPPMAQLPALPAITIESIPSLLKYVELLDREKALVMGFIGELIAAAQQPISPPPAPVSTLSVPPQAPVPEQLQTSQQAPAKDQKPKALCHQSVFTCNICGNGPAIASNAKRHFRNAHKGRDYDISAMINGILVKAQFPKSKKPF